GIRHLGRLVQAQFGLRGRGQPARPGDVVGVDVRVNDVAQAEVAFAEQGLIGLGVDGRVDDGRFAGLARGDHIRRTPTAFVEDLLEVHDCALRWLARQASCGIMTFGRERMTLLNAGSDPIRPEAEFPGIRLGAFRLGRAEARSSRWIAANWPAQHFAGFSGFSRFLTFRERDRSAQAWRLACRPRPGRPKLSDSLPAPYNPVKRPPDRPPNWKQIRKALSAPAPP